MALRVETDMPCGNAGDVLVVQDRDSTTVEFCAHPHGGPEALWFYLRLVRERESPRPGSPLRLVLKHLENMLGVDAPENIRPVYRTGAGEWERLPAGEVAELKDGRRRVAWDLGVPEVFGEAAFCYPYGPAEVGGLRRTTDRSYSADVIGISQGGRQLIRLASDRGAPEGKRRGLYLTARQHAGETPGSWVLDGLLRHMGDLGDEAPLIWAVPLVNIDGVMRGDYGKDNFPYDLNRAWGHPPMRHETLIMQRDFHRWRARCAPLLCLDFHAPGACEADGAYCFLPKPERFHELSQQAASWAKRIEASLGPEYAAEPFTRVADYPSRWETDSFTSFASTNRVPALTLETPYSLAGSRVLTESDYQEIGARLARAITTSQ